MKKTVRAIMSAVFASLLLCFTGCLAPATPDLGSGFVNNSGSNTNGTDSSSEGNWMLCKDSSYEIFDIQVWGDGAGTFDYENKSDCGRFTIKTVGGGWVGGGLIAADTTKKFDFSGVSKMKFEIRGTINPKALCIAVQNDGGASAKMYPSKSAMTTSAKLTSLNATDWQSVEFDVSGAASDKIINAFCIIAAGDWGSSFKPDEYFEIRNLDWVDSKGNSVKITLK